MKIEIVFVRSVNWFSKTVDVLLVLCALVKVLQSTVSLLHLDLWDAAANFVFACFFGWMATL